MLEMNSLTLFFYFFFSSIFLINAQSNIQFEHITSEKGLSQNDINTIIQDDEGFMWFGTHDGLNRYDGYSFKIFRFEESNPKSIPNNLVRSLQKDKEGNLWMINSNYGITRFNPKTEEFLSFKYEKGNEISAPSDKSSNISIDLENRLWVCSKNGVSFLDLDNLDKGFSHYTFSLKNKNNPVIVNNVFQSSDHQIWVGTEKGLFKAFFNGASNLTFIDATEDLNINFVPKVKVFHENKHGNLFLGTGNGVFLKRKNESLFKRVYNCTVFDLTSDDEMSLWVASTSGLHKLQHLEGHSFNYKETLSYSVENPLGPNRTSIRCVYKDRSGVFWAGTKGGGINKFYPKKNPFTTIKKSLSSSSLSYNNVRTVFKDSYGTLWVGTEDGNLNYSNGNDVLHPLFNEILETRNVFAMEEMVIGRKRYLYIGRQSDKTLLRIQLNEKKQYSKEDIELISLTKGSVFALEKTKENVLWVGTFSEGLYRLKIVEENVEVQHFDEENTNLSNSIIRSLLKDKKGNLWVGTAKGLDLLELDQLDSDEPYFKIFKHEKNTNNSISADYVLDIFESQKGNLWIGTLGGGLNLFSGDIDRPYFKHYNTKNGLSNNIIKAIEEDNEGFLWISSNKGISKLNPINGDVSNFGISDGLQGEEFLELSSFKTKEGLLVFGGTNGFNVFNPLEVKEINVFQEPLLSSFYLLNTKVEVGEIKNKRVLLEEGINYKKDLFLKPKENSFSIEFSTTNFLASEKNKFKYKLVGFEEDWQEVDAQKRFATYTNLSPGDYVFKLKAKNGARDKECEEKVLHINIEYPWWQTPLAFVAYLLIFSGLLIAFRRFTIVRAEEKHKYEVSKLEQKQSEDLQQMKLEFFTNISHEFRTPLTLLKGPLDILDKNNDLWDASQRKKQYDLMKKNTNYLLRLVNQLLDFRRLDREKMELRISNLDVILFVKETSEPYIFLASKKQIDFNIIGDEGQLVVPFDPDVLEKILNNLLFNAFKFTSTGNTVTVKIEDGDSFKNPVLLEKKLNLSDYVVIQIKDTGKGIPKDKLDHIFERYYTERDENIQGAGIGLSFAKKLIELHDGFISVESYEGKGTTFFVLLPKHRNDVSLPIFSELENELNMEGTVQIAPDIKGLAHELKEDLQNTNKGKLSSQTVDLIKILIVEDNSDIRDFIKNGVDEKYEFLEASNGQEGLDLVRIHRPNVIISDIMMPVMDGFEMVSKIIAEEAISNIPIIMLTAKSSKETEKQALKLGVVDFIRKPFDLEVLLLKISNVLNKQQQLKDHYHEKVSIEPKEIEVTSVEERFLQQAMQIVEENMMNTEFSVEMLVSEMGMSRSNLYLKIKEVTGLSSSEFIRSVRLKRAVQLLKKSNMSVKEIMYMTGFNTASYFSKCFKKQYGVVPSEYMKTLNKKQNTLKDYLS